MMLDDVDISEMEQIASVPNLDNCTTCSCSGFCLKMQGRNACPCRSVQLCCTRACHGDEMDRCMNIRRVVGETDSDVSTVKNNLNSCGYLLSGYLFFVRQIYTPVICVKYFTSPEGWYKCMRITNLHWKLQIIFTAKLCTKDRMRNT